MYLFLISNHSNQPLNCNLQICLPPCLHSKKEVCFSVTEVDLFFHIVITGEKKCRAGVRMEADLKVCLQSTVRKGQKLI